MVKYISEYISDRICLTDSKKKIENKLENLSFHIKSEPDFYFLLPSQKEKGKGPSLITLSKAHENLLECMKVIWRPFFPEHWSPGEVYVFLNIPLSNASIW